MIIAGKAYTEDALIGMGFRLYTPKHIVRYFEALKEVTRIVHPNGDTHQGIPAIQLAVYMEPDQVEPSYFILIKEFWVNYEPTSPLGGRFSAVKKAPIWAKQLTEYVAVSSHETVTGTEQMYMPGQWLCCSDPGTGAFYVNQKFEELYNV